MEQNCCVDNLQVSEWLDLLKYVNLETAFGYIIKTQLYPEA